MSKNQLANELLMLRRQIAQLRRREAQVQSALQETESPLGAARPGWPIQRLQHGDCAQASH